MFGKLDSKNVELKYAVLDKIIENKNPEIKKGSIARMALCIFSIITKIPAHAGFFVIQKVVPE